MTIDLTELNRFFSQYKTRPMPSVLIEQIMKGNNYSHSGLETLTIEWSNLKQLFAPEIANKIKVTTTGRNIPVLRKTLKPDYFVYHPSTGLYLGDFKVNP